MTCKGCCGKAACPEKAKIFIEAVAKPICSMAFAGSAIDVCAVGVFALVSAPMLFFSQNSSEPNIIMAAEETQEFCPAHFYYIEADICLIGDINN